jgi:AAA ATPase domain/Effector-associated domain 1
MLRKYEVFRELREVLASIYLDEKSTQRIAAEAGLDLRLIDWSGTSISRWQAVLEEAEQDSDHTRSLLSLAIHEYKSATLKIAIDKYTEWVAAGEPLTEREKQLEQLAKNYRLLPPKPDFAPIAPNLKSRFDRLLEKHALFGGREHELERLEHLLTDQNKGYLFVTGPSGFGKSALLANWVKSLQTRGQAVCFSFINRAEGLADEHFFLQNMGEQLCEFHGLRGNLPTQETTLRVLYPQLLQIPLEAGQKLVVVVDGLDEAMNWKLAGDLFPVLPDGVFVVFSARAEPGLDVPATLGLTVCETIELTKLSLSEIAGLLRSLAAPVNALAEDLDFVTAVLEVSEGDPFYLRFLVDDILLGTITASNIKLQPQGLTNHLELWWQQLNDDVNIATNEVYALLGLLSVAKGYLFPKDFAGISAILNKGLLVKKELDGKLRRYLTGNLEHGYAISHPRFGAYLVEEKFGTEEVEAYREQLRLYCTNWLQHKSSYALRYGVQHLEDAARGAKSADTSHDLTRQLVELVVTPDFQETRLADLEGLQADLVCAVNVAVWDEDGSTEVLMQAALGLIDFRQNYLQPKPMFALAGQGNPLAAQSRMALFDVETEWQQASRLLIAWLSCDTNKADALTLFERMDSERPSNEPLATLHDWVKAALKQTPPTPVQAQDQLELHPSEVEIRAIVERMQGSGNAELLQQGQFATLGVSELGYLTRIDGPKLVAFAQDQPAQGSVYLEQYVAMHAGYGYAYYRNRSLWILLDAIVRHPSADWVRDMAVRLATVALTGSRTDFREALPIAVQALQARIGGDQTKFNTQLQDSLQEANKLRDSHRQGDLIGLYKRRLSARSEALSQILERQAETVLLLETAQNLPFGFAGYGATAYLSLAESVRVCQPSNWYAIQSALDAARMAAHNIQDDTFCARSTARVHAMQEHFWMPTGLSDLREIIGRLLEHPLTPEFTALHVVGETYQERNGSNLRLPSELLQANTLRALANAFKRPLIEFQRLTRDQGWGIDQVLEPNTQVPVPDTGFRTLVAARLAAEVLSDLSFSPLECAKLIRSLIPVAAPNPTALDTVLARLLLANLPTDLNTLKAYERLTAYPVFVDTLTVPPGLPA